MYTITALYKNKDCRYEEFYHITKISYGKGVNSITVNETEFITYNFPFDQGLNLYSDKERYSIYPNNIISLKFEKEDS